MPRIFKVVVLAVLAVLVSLVAVAPAAVAEDLTIVSKVTASKGPSGTSTQYISSTKLRTSDGQSDTIVDLESGKLVFVDHKKKRYSETTFEEMRAHFAELEKMLDSNPMLGKMLGEATAVNVQETSESQEIVGYSCKKYVLTMGKNLSFEIWATSDLEPPVEYYEAHKMLYALMGPIATRFEKMFDEMKKVGGVSLKTTIDSKFMGMGFTTTSEVVELRKGDLPADAFAIPAGYKKGKSPFE